MSDYRKTLGTGLVVAVGAGAVWAAGKYLAKGEKKLIDWNRVRRIAVNNSRQSVLGYPFSKRVLTEKYSEMVRKAEQPISEYTGQKMPKPLESIHVFDRVDWIDANITSFQEMFEPFEKLNRQVSGNASGAAFLMGSLNQMLLSSQMGILMGYLAQRVLGQYDLSLFGKEPAESGKLFFVEPNIFDLEQRLGLDPEEFRMWVSLHELTHAFEFEAHSWVRGYLQSLMNRYLRSVSSDLFQMHSHNSGFRSLVGRVGTNLLKSSHILELLMTPEQRHLFSQLQAIMCLLEGYSNHVMQAIGKSLLPGYDELKARFDERGKNKSAAERFFTKLTGLDIKLEQYVLGERFVNDIVAERGIEFLNQVWQSPMCLPTLDEVRAPAKWITRMDRLAAA
ncbi:MAG: zinc-dependent metalloprotease [Chloroflexi bacterium]|nr:zinc-dependent metalloprotease [Chloroflexota bacterium]